MTTQILQRWWHSLDKPGWRAFGIAMLALGVAMLFALYSAAAAERGWSWTAAAAAAISLGLAVWVAVAIVPALARRTPLRWLVLQINYRITREGWVYVGGIFALAFAALNTGNNLLFIILSAMLAAIAVSGVVSRLSITGVDMSLALPEHVFAEQPVLASVKLTNHKLSLPSFSLRVGADVRQREFVRDQSKESRILTRPVYFPFIPRQQALEQAVELQFPRRGIYRQDAFAISTRFPFGFLEKTRKVESPMEVVVYPRVLPTEEFYEILPMISGELESFHRGRGHDLYSIRDSQPTDSARFVDWKASARATALKVREFTREDERRVALVLDPYVHPAPGQSAADLTAQFERAVTFAACLAWHFHEIDSEMQFRTDELSTPMSLAGDIIYDVLRHLAFIQSKPASIAGDAFLVGLNEEPDLFKIIITSRPRGSLPTHLWTSSYFVFMQSL
ncbi:MAG: DUF58 domain-containing protein [Candidatus Acidiferrales bacterium]